MTVTLFDASGMLDTLRDRALLNYSFHALDKKSGKSKKSHSQQYSCQNAVGY